MEDPTITLTGDTNAPAAPPAPKLTISQRISAFTSSNAKLGSQLAERDTQVSELRGQLSDITSKYGVAEGQLSAMREELTAARLALAELDEQVSNVSEGVTSALAEIGVPASQVPAELASLTDTATSEQDLLRAFGETEDPTEKAAIYARLAPLLFPAPKGAVTNFGSTLAA